jgi:hypothetical protein
MYVRITRIGSQYICTESIVQLPDSCSSHGNSQESILCMCMCVSVLSE